MLTIIRNLKNIKYFLVKISNTLKYMYVCTSLYSIINFIEAEKRIWTSVKIKKKQQKQNIRKKYMIYYDLRTI